MPGKTLRCNLALHCVSGNRPANCNRPQRLPQRARDMVRRRGRQPGAWLLAVAAALFACAAARAGTPPSTPSADAEFARGNYGAAGAQYKALAREQKGQRRAFLYFNAGVAFGKAQMLGQAARAFGKCVKTLVSSARGTSPARLADARRNLGVVQLRRAAALWDALRALGVASHAGACESYGAPELACESLLATRDLGQKAAGNLAFAADHLLSGAGAGSVEGNALAALLRDVGAGHRLGGQPALASRWLRRALRTASEGQQAGWSRGGAGAPAELGGSPVALDSAHVAWAAEWVAAEEAACAEQQLASAVPVDAAGGTGSAADAAACCLGRIVRGVRLDFGPKFTRARPGGSEGSSLRRMSLAAASAAGLLGSAACDSAAAQGSGGSAGDAMLLIRRPADAFMLAQSAASGSPRVAPMLGLAALTQAPLGWLERTLVGPASGSLAAVVYEALRALRSESWAGLERRDTRHSARLEAAASLMAAAAADAGVWAVAEQTPAFASLPDAAKMEVNATRLWSEPFPGCRGGDDVSRCETDWDALAVSLRTHHGAAAATVGLGLVRDAVGSLGELVRQPHIRCELLLAAGQSLVSPDKCGASRLPERSGANGAVTFEGAGLSSAGQWKQVVLARDGVFRHSGEAAAPAASAAIAAALAGGSLLPPLGSVEVSVLEPGAAIRPHCGPTPTRWRIHVPLLVPAAPSDREQARLIMPGQVLRWRRGHPVVIDDSFWHSVNASAMDPSQGPRVVLLVDVWHPALAAASDGAKQAVVAQLGARGTAETRAPHLPDTLRRVGVKWSALRGD